MEIVLVNWPQHELILIFECQIFCFSLSSIFNLTIKLPVLAFNFSFEKLHFGLSLSVNCSLWKTFLMVWFALKMHVKNQPQNLQSKKTVLIFVSLLLAGCRFWGTFFCNGQDDVKYEKQYAGNAKKVCKFFKMCSKINCIGEWQLLEILLRKSWQEKGY